MLTPSALPYAVVTDLAGSRTGAAAHTLFRTVVKEVHVFGERARPGAQMEPMPQESKPR